MLAAIFLSVILAKELVAATDKCTKYQFKSPFFPGKSCEDIYNKNPESHNWSGYYWITDGPCRVYCGMTYTGSSCSNIYNDYPAVRNKSGYYRINESQWVYCGMTYTGSSCNNIYNNYPEVRNKSGYYRINGTQWIYCTENCAGVGGGWQRIVDIDVSAGDDCPSGWTKANNSGYSFCTKLFDGIPCSPTMFTTNGVLYQKVCGKARGYQKGDLAGELLINRSIERGNGLSITYGNPRQHIWTYAVGRHDNGVTYCPCDNPGGETPSFVGNNYYCESGSSNTSDVDAYFFDDPLWDGSGCIYSNCCSVPNQPWFYRQLNESTSADIEVRLCDWRKSYKGFTLIDQLVLYIQ